MTTNIHKKIFIPAFLIVAVLGLFTDPSEALSSRQRRDTTTLTSAKQWKTILPCYRNSSVFDPTTRLPMSMQNFIGIVRKIETRSLSRNWDLSTTANVIMHTFRYDGIQMSATGQLSDPPSDALRLMTAQWSLVPADGNEFPDNALDQVEECSAHWMLSYAVNTTNTTCVSSDSTSYSVGCASENGVIRTRTGTVAAGPLIAGIAAALEPQNVTDYGSQPSGTDCSKTSRVLMPQYCTSQGMNNLWAATLAGNVASYAIAQLTITDDTAIGERGWWNGTRNMPRTYYLRTSPPSDLTAALIRGGIDGLLIGQQLKNWYVNNYESKLKLSQILEMYYSELGVSANPTYRSCNRAAKFKESVNVTQLIEQATCLGYYLECRYGGGANVGASQIQQNVEQTVKNTLRALEQIEKADRKCDSQPDEFKTKPVYGPHVNLYAVADFSVTTADDFQYQRELLAAIAQNLDISTWTSKMGVFANNNSFILPLNFSVNAGKVAERVYDMRYRWNGQVDIAGTLNAIWSDIYQMGFPGMGTRESNTNVVLFISLGSQVSSDTYSDVKNMLATFKEDFPASRVLFLTNYGDAYSTGFLDGSTESILVPTKNGASDGLSIANTVLKAIPAPLLYYNCRQSNTTVDEPTHVFTGYVEPGSVQLLRYLPRNFFSSTALSVTLQSQSGNLRVCMSRDTVFPYNQTDNPIAQCQHTNATSPTVLYNFGNPCLGASVQNCKPIYFSVQGYDPKTTCTSQFTTQTAEIPTACRFPKQVPFTITHSGMQCSSATMQLASFSLLLGALLVWFGSSTNN